jgi:hypothetical protein
MEDPRNYSATPWVSRGVGICRDTFSLVDQLVGYPILKISFPLLRASGKKFPNIVSSISNIPFTPHKVIGI